MTPNESQFWDLLMPIIGPPGPQQRTLAVAYVIAAVRGVRYVDAAMVDRLADDLRQRFGAKESPCH